ncbi:hypothetical protein ACHAXT_011841 [Thalassiosira profunda]
MMGGSCSRIHDDGRPPRRRRRRGESEGGGSRPCRGSGRRLRSRSLSGAVGRLCGGLEHSLQYRANVESSDDESQAKATKRAARHSVDAEVPDQSISHLYPADDNYELHPTNPTLRCPKSLTDLCIDAICRSLPNLEGELPPNLPQDVVDRIVQSLTSHAALNSTTLRALRHCELGALSLANCRGVSDEWLAPLGEGNVAMQRLRSASAASSDCVMSNAGYLPPSPPPVPDLAVPSSSGPPSFLDAGSASSLMMDLDDLTELNASDGMSDGDPQSVPLLPPQARQGYDDRDAESRSTSSFVSASSTPYAGTGDEERPPSPLLPSVFPPPEFFSLKYSPAPPSSLWLHPMRGAEGLKPPPLMPSLPVRADNPPGANQPLDESLLRNFDDASVDHGPIVSTTANLSLLDLRGSQRLTDRGLLQLSGSPLHSLEVAKLDNCHGITGRGLLAFSGSHRLHTLSLANCRRLTDEAVVNLAHLGGLTSLNLGGCRCLTDRSLEALAGLVGLRQLDLSQCDLVTDDGLANLHDLKQIEELSLGWCRLITDDGLEILSEQPDRSKVLRTLRLARCSLTDYGLHSLEKLESLEELDLNGCVRISSAALGDALEKLLHLTSLDVSYCPGILRSSWQGKIKALRSLELCYSGVRDSQLARLRDLPALEELNLDSCIVADWGIAHLVDNNVMPNLTTLDLADTDISDASMAKLAQFKEMRHLSLFYCNISNRGLSMLASMENLEVLNLDSRDIGDDGLRYLRNLPLRSLDLFSSRVTDLGCAYLSKIKSLRSLELCGGGVGDLGCAHIATLSNLTSLNLSQNEGVTNRGAACLAALTNLQCLNLSNTSVSPDALKFFAGLLKLQSLAFASNEDGVIDREDCDGDDSGSEVDEEEDEDSDEEIGYGEEMDDEEMGDEEEIVYHQLDSDDDHSMDSEEYSLSDYVDANDVHEAESLEV